MSSSSSDFTIIDLLRHGEVQGGPCFRGSQDDPLTETGWNQMYKAVADDSSWQTIVTSPLKRCYDFASQFSADCALPITEDHRFAEMHFGDWEGKTAEQVQQLAPDFLGQFWSAPERHTPPNGEAFFEFKARVLNAWQDLLHTFDGQHILLVSHAGVIRTILAEILQMPTKTHMRLELPFASLSRVRVFKEDKQYFPSLVYHGK